MRRPLLLLASLLLGALSIAAAQTEPPSGADLQSLQGRWHSPPLPSGPDSVIIRTLQIGQPDRPDFVRLSWSMYCGRNSIAGDYDFTGRLITIESKGPARRLILVDAQGARTEVPFELAKDQLLLKGAIKKVDVTYEWKRERPPAKKE
jgi:hypothetical protein